MAERTPLAERFWAKVDKNGPLPEYRPELGPCWLWLAGQRKGYGQFSVNRQKRPAHRFAYELLIGPIPQGLEPDHLCRVRACVKAIADECGPAHLEPVTRRENARRGDCGIHMRGKTHCKRGHEFTEANTLWTSDGRRQCHACELERWRRYRHRKAAQRLMAR